MSIQQALAIAIDSWLKAKPGRSLNMLARLAATSYSSVRRAAQGEVEQTQSTVVPIASVIMSNVELREFLRQYYPSLERAIADVRRLNSANEPIAHIENEDAVVNFLNSEEHVKILILANSKTGTNDQEVIRKYGENYLSYFNDMKSSGILRHDNENWYFEGAIGNVSLSLARKVLCSLAKSFDIRNDSIKHASYSYILWESLNPDAIAKIYELTERHAKEVCAIADNPDNRGDLLLVYGLLHNVIKGAEVLS